MLSGAQIVQRNNAVAVQHCKRNLTPYVCWTPDEILTLPVDELPVIGRTVPFGWELTGDYWYLPLDGHDPEARKRMKAYAEENDRIGFGISGTGKETRIVSAFRKQEENRG